MAKIKNSISTLIETQLPEFITTEYELFGNFLTKYYESLEIQGAPLDIANNLATYSDIGYYESKLLEQSSELVGNLSDSSTTITVTDARSFPKENGYIKIGKEICFYKSRTDTEFLEVSRGVSGNTKLGDLYNTTEFVTSQASTHSGGELVQNISNLFLYALVKNFEEQYLASFPEKYLKEAVDKRSLIKNIGQFYRAKGTEKSIQFLFNTVIAGGQENKPEVYNPSDFTYKSSTSDWTQGYALRVKVLSGNVEDLVGQVIVQQEGPRNGYASATVDNVRFDSTVDGEDTYNLFLATETINGIFEFTAKTELTKEILSTDSQGDRINVASTLGWNDKGTLLINGETFTFEDKNITQFEINSRTQTTIHPAGSIVYDPIYIGSGNVQLLVFGLAYNLLPSNAQPYSSVNDPIEVSNPGFETTDPKIVSPQGIRWLLSNTNDKPTSPTNPAYTSNLANLSTDVSAVFSDEQFYYIASSGYPSYPILENVTSIPGNLADQKILKLIRKQATSTTEIYKTPNLDSGIFINGARVYSYKDTETVRFGKLERITVQNQGSSYKNPPYVLVNGVSGRAVAKLAGQFVESVEVLEPGLYGQTPTVEITSGRGAEIRATITFGAVTDLIIDNPGEYYSTPPLVVITDLAGQGRLAEYTARVSNGEIVGFDLVNQGSFYSQDNVRVTILPVGQNAVATPELTEWVKDRYYNLQNKLDDNNGFVFENYNRALEYGYAHVANPKSLRVRLNDNLSSLGVEPANKVHSPILGFAYDGNPIYGPFAHENPLDQQSPVVRMTSSYILKPSRSFGPSTQEYPLGSFIQDYEYRHQSGSLDQNNGRFCVTPDFPEGTYAYFITINSQQVPQFPYVIGENFYSLPVESNYASNLNQTNLSKNVKRLFTPGLQVNGGGVNAIIQDLESGSIESIDVESSSDSFSVGSSLVFDNSGTEGNGVEATVNSVKGKSVNYLQSFESKVVKLVITRDSYVFAGDFLRQPGSGAFGTIVGDVKADNTILVKDVNGTFDDSATFSTDIKVVRLTIDKVSSFAQGSTIELTDGVVTVAAKGEVLESIVAGNTLIVKVTSGTFEDQEDLPGYFIKSSSLSDTSGAKIDDVEYLSDGLIPFDIDDNIALVETSSEHKLGIGDVVNVSINPDDATKTRTYFVRKRIYQELQLQTPTYNTVVNYSGIGRGIILNSGSLYDVGSYTNVPLTGGSGESATANIVVSPDTPNSATGYISDIQITDGGTGYKRGDVLGVADSSLGKVPGSSTQTLRFFIDHVGISEKSTRIDVKSAVEYAENDLLKIDDEIVKIVSLTNNQVQGGTLIVERAQLGTKAVDHYDGATVSLYDGGYNFDANFTVNGSESVIYNKEKQTLLVIYPSTQSLSTLQAITETTTFFDDSTPQRFVNIITASSAENRFEFRLDPSMSIFGTTAPNTYTSDWVVNPIIEVQEFYKYRFDTSDNSLTGASLDFSPSGNYNIISVEKTEPAILQGSPGSFVEMKFGFGAAIASNQYTEEEASRFANYFYFDRNNTISSSGSYLTVIQDPLAGRQVVNYVTPTRFSYSLKKNPQWDGSGDISYTTTGSFAVGEIDSVSIQNIGSNYKKTPIVLGAYLNTESQASATVLFDPLLDTITSVRVDVEGSNYSKPKVVILEGDGVDAEFGVTSRDGKVLDIFVVNKGTDYTKAPTIAIIESDVKLFAQGSRIGRPKNVKMIKNGSSFHRDNTLLSEYTSSYTFAVTGYGDSDFLKGETITQTSGNDIILRAKVNEWRHGSNLLKLSNIQGNVRNNLPLVGEISKTSATIKSEYKTVFDLDLRPYSNNTGSYRSDRGKLGVSNQRLIDSFFYQDYSYVVKSRTAIDNWRELVKETTHPAGFKLFGEVIIDPVVDDGITMPTEMPKASHFSIIELWDANKNKVTVESTTRTITQSVLSVDDYRAIRGSGSVAVNEFDFNYTNAFELTLRQDPTDPSPLDGRFNGDGQLVGTRSFTLYNNGAPFNPYSAENLIVTIDGVLQEPGVAYTISSNQIVFATPPLGYNVVEGQNVYEQKVLIRYIEFKNDVYNDKHFRKIRNFYQRNGRWLDAANQILLNVDFIVAESIGYFEAKYASEIANATIPWTAIENEVQGDIRNLCAALEHDLRFGGNIKSVDYAELFASSYSAQNTQINDLFQYVVRLAKLAARNWDWIAIGASYTAGSDIITISDTSNIALGAVVSSGQAIPLSSGYKVIEIVSDTEVRIDGTALTDSGTAPPGSGGPGTTYLSGTQSGNLTLPTATGAVVPPNSYALPPGTTLTAPPVFAGLDQVTFSFSGINNGTYYDASNLIDKNRDYIVDYAINWAKATYPGLQWSQNETKCRRDTGYLLDAVIYSLRFGGNLKLVEFAELYFVGSQLNYIVGEFVETKTTYQKVLTELCVDAMRQTLQASQYTNIIPVIDPEVIVDAVSPTCAGVESALNTYYDIIETILDNGPNVIQPTQQNPSKRGLYTRLVPYANYSIIPDNQLVSRECEDVVSALSTYASIVEEYMVNDNTVTKSLPDFIDNETSEFELYWDDDGSPVALTETDEHLLVAFNGVIQRPKYNPDEPAFDSYWVDRTVTPNVIKFTAPPIWDQDLSAKTIQEPTMVEKFFATNIGNYRRYTIDKSLVNGVRKGPFLILSVDGDRILNIDDQNYMIVIVNGVIQKPTTAYEVAGASITFKYPMRDEDVVDIRLCYGRDLDPSVTFHDFDINGYLYDYTLEVNGTNAGVNFNSFALTTDWALTTKDKFYIYQEDSNGTYGIGSVYDWKQVGDNQVVVKMYSNNIDYDPSRATYMKTMGATTVSTYTFDPSSTLTLTKNYDFLSRTDKSYFAQDVKRSNDLLQRKGFFRLAPGDKVKIDGESNYRTIRSIPDEVYTRDNRLDGDAGNDIYGSFGISSYNGKTMGEGLSVSAEITNGVVTALTWNERIVEPITNSDGSITYKFYRPTAFNYETPPKLMFVPRDGNGGGARAVVLVERGYIQGIQLLYGGSGYTEAPKVVVTRKYDVKKQDDIKVSLVKLGVQSVVTQGLTVISNVSTIQLPPPEQALLTVVVLDSVQDVREALEQEIYPEPLTGEEAGGSIPDGQSQPGMGNIVYIEPDPIPDPVIVDGSGGILRIQEADREVARIVSVRAEDIVSISQHTTSRFVTQTVQREIANTFLDNVIYRAPGAYLQAPLNIGDTIVYIPDTSKFTSNGKLMVGDEVVYYPRKRGDRFLNVTRGFEGTTEKNWAPGTFIRQIEDFVSVAYGGVAEIHSETVVRNSIPTGVTERKRQQQVETPATFAIQTEIQHTSELQLPVDVESISSVSKEIVKIAPAGGNNIVSDFTNFRPVATVATAEIQVQTKVITEVQPAVVSELLFFAPPGGLVDYFQEIVFFTNPVVTRLNGDVALVTRDVTQRSGTVISIRNISESEQVTYIGNYTVGNVGPNISSWQTVGKDTGTLSVSDISIAQFEMLFPSFTLREFELRGDSNYTLTGQKFNLGLPTVNNAVTVCFTSGTIGSTITVQNTDHFPASGYIFHGAGSTSGIIQYTGKTATTFTGCTVYNGSSTITNGSEVIPFVIT